MDENLNALINVFWLHRLSYGGPLMAFFSLSFPLLYPTSTHVLLHKCAN